jgi:hypothetical protein
MSELWLGVMLRPLWRLPTHLFALVVVPRLDFDFAGAVIDHNERHRAPVLYRDDLPNQGNLHERVRYVRMTAPVAEAAVDAHVVKIGPVYLEVVILGFGESLHA